MKSIIKTPVAFLIFLFTCTAHSVDKTEIEQKVIALNAQSINSLGVSLHALLYLVDASPNTYFLLSTLEKTGEIAFIRELETKGYVKIQIEKGMPVGPQKNETLLRVIPLDSGAELQHCLVALKDSSNLQPAH